MQHEGGESENEFQDEDDDIFSSDGDKKAST